MRDVISEAIIAHKRWKIVLDEAIETGTCKLSVDMVKSDRNCILGKWINNLNDNPGTIIEYDKLRELHLKFHKYAAEVLKLALEGKKKQAKKATGPGSKYDECSTKLINMLGKLHEKTICI
ncbi:MAG: CZB domain-containing protein [Candidatus Micrarchaeota archaeon]